MPAKDGTGPLGQGTRSGRGMGNCTPKKQVDLKPSISASNNLFDLILKFGGAIFGQADGRGRQNRGNRK